MKIKKTAKRVWRFLWYEDSLTSWVVSIVLAVLLIKFVVYPALGLILGTKLPVVAVVSSSMEHNTRNFSLWWEKNKNFYENLNISKKDFENFIFANGFNKGDIVVLFGTNPKKLKVGDVIVFRGSLKNPIIHRIVKKWKENNSYYFQTKGDNNPASRNDELRIGEKFIYGKAVARIPWLGWVKIMAIEILKLVT